MFTLPPKMISFYKKNKKDYLSKYKSQFVLIKNDNFLGNYTTENEAYNAGVEKFGTEPFLIKQVIEEDETDDVPSLTIGIIHASI